MTVVRSGDELARVVWKHGLDPWLKARPGWQARPARFGPSSVTFDVHGPDGQVRLRIGPDRGDPDRLTARALEGDVDSPVVDELARVIEAVGRKGVRVAPPRLPVVELDQEGRIELFIASGCDLDCGFCCEAERVRKKEWMPWDTLREQLEEAADRGVARIQFMGGEATLNPRFPDALAYARRLGLGTYVITNLLQWRRRAFAEAVAPHLQEVMISMHAWGEAGGRVVYDRDDWWPRYQLASRNALETLQARVKVSTVLTRHSVDDLERIAEHVLGFGPTSWIMGNAVPVVNTRQDAVDANLSIDELRALRPRLEALKERCADAGCRLVLFCFPHCVLGPTLWDDTHDDVVDNQDLSETADGDVASVHFWSQADYLSSPRPVTLGRSRPPACDGCLRAERCGGWFTEYFQRRGTDELRPVVA